MARKKKEAAEATAAEGTVEGEHPPVTLPSAVTLLAPYGFVDEKTGVHRYWQMNQVVNDSEDVLLLLARNAPLEFLC